MIRKIHTITSVLLVMILTGCIETHLLVNVRKDGSGTIQETVKLKTELILPFLEFASAMKAQGSDEEDESGEPPVLELFSEDHIRERAAKFGDKVAYLSHRAFDDEEWRGYTAQFAFDNINTVRLNSNPGDAVPAFPGEMDDAQATEEDVVEFSFTSGASARLLVRTPVMQQSSHRDGKEDSPGEQGVEPETDEERAQGMEEMKRIFQDMRISIKITVDGAILESNAMFREGSTVTILDVEFAKLIENEDALKRIEAMDDLTTSQMKELMTTIPGIQFDPSDEILILFR